MIGDAAEDAGALEGAEGFLAGMGGVAGEEEGDAQDAHAGTGRQGRRDIEMVDEVPLAVILDSAKATIVKVHVHGHEGRFQ